MKKDTLGGHSSINAYIKTKLKRFSESGSDIGTLFEFMFSERENIMFEWSDGYRIGQLTYGECRDRALRRAASLKARLSQAQCGSVIGLYMNNSAEWMELFWAILAAGFKPLLMNGRLGHAALDRALSDMGAVAVVSDMEAEKSFCTPILTVDELAPNDESMRPASFGESILVMSSGTSESVKICEYTGAELRIMIADSAELIRRCPAIKKHYNGMLKLLALLPFYHIFGFAAVYMWFAFFSRTFVLLSDLSPRTVTDTIRRHEVTHIFAVPMFWNKVHAQAVKAIRERGKKTFSKFENGLRVSDSLAGVPLLGGALCRFFRRIAFREVRTELFGRSIRFMISGGSEIGGDVLRFFNGIGYRLANGFGMTETGITSVELSGDLKTLCSGSVGLPFASIEYSIDESGRLLVGGNSMAKRVYEGGNIHERSERFQTGDLAEYRNGRYYILGRADDIVISPSGENLNPCIIEDKLTVPGVREVCLTKVRENGPIVPTVIASLEPLIDGNGIKRAHEALKRAMAEAGLDGQAVKIALVRESLIGKDDFKPVRARIAMRLSEGGFTLVDPSADHETVYGDHLTERIRLLFAEVLDKDASAIMPTTDFFLDAGGTSLDFYAVAAALSEEYGVTLPPNSLQALSRPCDIARFITEKANGI